MRIISFLPEQTPLEFLGKMRGNITLLSEGSSIDRRNNIFIRSADSALRAEVRYRDVMPKFEIFGIFLNATWAEPDVVSGNRLLLEGPCTISTAFRFEWERPANRGEVPKNWDQKISSRGKASDIPESATAASVSLVGILFESKQANHQLFLHTSDDQLGSFGVLTEQDEIQRATADCETILMADLFSWMISIENWIKRKGTNI